MNGLDKSAAATARETDGKPASKAPSRLVQDVQALANLKNPIKPDTIFADITHREAFWVNVMRLNKAELKHDWRVEWTLFGWSVTFRWQSKNNLMGRFGGGWNWVLGFEAGGRTIIFNLLVCSLRIARPKKEADAGGG